MTDAAIQICWCRATISLNLRCYLQHIQHPASSDLTQNNATVPSGSYGEVGCHDCCSVKLGDAVHFSRGIRANVTMAFEVPRGKISRYRQIPVNQT